MFRTFSSISWITVVLLFPISDLFALTGRVIAPNGTPLRDAQVSIAGRSNTVPTDADGVFVIQPEPRAPLTLIVIGPRGEIYQPVEIANVSAPLIINLSPTASEAITVTTGVAPAILSTPASATVFIGREDIEQRVPEHLVDSVTRVAGVERRGEGPPAVPVIRGLAGGRTAILVDDARVIAERRAGPSATFLDPFSLASVEVARGPGSVAYGSDAFGGVIHARSRDPEPRRSLRYELSTGFGSSDADSAGISFSTPLGRGAASLLLYGRESDGSSSAGGLPIVNSQYSSRGGALRVVFPIARGAVRAAVSIDQNSDVGAPGRDATIQRTYYPNEESKRATFGADQSYRGNQFELRAAIGTYEITTNRERFATATSLRQVSSAEVNARDASVRLTAVTPTRRAQFHSGVDFASRFDLRAEGSITAFDAPGAVATRTEEISIDQAARHDFGLFTIADVPLTSSITFTGGLRFDALQIENRGGFFGSQSRSDNAWSGHAAATWVSGPINMSLQIGSGFREPTLSDRFFRGISGRGFVVGNPDLRPERSLQADYAVRWQRGPRSAAFFAYNYRIRNLIERYSTGTDFAFRNRGEATVRGVELEVATPLPLHLSVMANISAARGESGGQPLDDITPLKSVVEVRWARRRASAFVTGIWLGRHDRPGPVETVRPSYIVADAGAGWRLHEHADLRLSVRNVFDERHAASTDANAALAPGRAVTVSIHGRL